MKKFLIVLLVVILVVVIGLEAYMLFFRGDEEAAGGPAPSATMSPSMTLPPVATAIPATPVPTAIPATPVPTAIPATPVPTATPAPTAPPKPTVSPVPTATPEPTATPAPTMPPDSSDSGGSGSGSSGGGETGGGGSFTPSSGSFSSGTGTGLDLIVSWKTEDLGNGMTRVYVSGSASSYSLDVMSTKATISFNGQSTTASCSSISQGETQTKAVNGLFSTSLDVPQGSAGTLTVDWAFKGSYGGTSLATISASGNVDA